MEQATHLAFELANTTQMLHTAANMAEMRQTKVTCTCGTRHMRILS